MSEPTRILVSDAIAEEGIDLLREAPGFEVTFKTGLDEDELTSILGDFDGLIVRSATKVTARALGNARRLKAIGRAGTGVDNIDLEAATKNGTVVMNTPGGNSVAAAEHTIALLLALARNVAQASADLREGRWERKRYMGVEVAGKTLGVIGLGRIGRLVAQRGAGMKMKVIGYDPFVTREAAATMGIEYAELDDILRRSDFVTIHVPRTPETRHLIDAKALNAMKPEARLINCARGGLVDEKALFEAIDSGRIAGAALDVFESEPPGDSPLVGHPHVVSTPHLGASTVEAQRRVGVEIAEKVRDYLQQGVILDAVNFPSISREEHAAVGPLMDLAERLGRFSAQAIDGGFSKLELRCHGGFVDVPLKPLVMAAAKGLLQPVVEGGVTFVNALALAQDRGITVEDGRSNEGTPYAGLLRLTLHTDNGKLTVAGTLDATGAPRMVELDGLPVDCKPEGNLLLLRNRDVPGVVGQLGTILARAEVNIAGILLGREKPGGDAVSIVRVDGPVPEPTLDEIRGLSQVLSVRAIKI